MLDPFDSGIQYGSLVTTFKFQGVSGGTTANVTLNFQRIGNFAMLWVPNVTVNVGTGTNVQLFSTVALPTWMRPSVDTQGAAPFSVFDNGAVSVTPGFAQIATTGFLDLRRDPNGTTAWTNSAVGGIHADFTIAYYIGYGS